MYIAVVATTIVVTVGIPMAFVIGVLCVAINLSRPLRNLQEGDVISMDRFRNVIVSTKPLGFVHQMQHETTWLTVCMVYESGWSELVSYIGLDFHVRREFSRMGLIAFIDGEATRETPLYRIGEYNGRKASTMLRLERMRLEHPVRVIQRAWRRAITDPSYSPCRCRLAREFGSLSEILL